MPEGDKNDPLSLALAGSWLHSPRHELQPTEEAAIPPVPSLSHFPIPISPPHPLPPPSPPHPTTSIPSPPPPSPPSPPLLCLYLHILYHRCPVSFPAAASVHHPSCFLTLPCCSLKGSRPNHLLTGKVRAAPVPAPATPGIPEKGPQLLFALLGAPDPRWGVRC